MNQPFCSECRDSNSRPLEPHSSAIPNFATPGYFVLLSPVSWRLRYINIQFSKMQALFFIFSKKFFAASVNHWKYWIYGGLHALFRTYSVSFRQTNLARYRKRLFFRSRKPELSPPSAFYSPRSLLTTLPIFHRWATAFSASFFSSSLSYSM